MVGVDLGQLPRRPRRRGRPSAAGRARSAGRRTVISRRCVVGSSKSTTRRRRGRRPRRRRRRRRRRRAGSRAVDHQVGLGDLGGLPDGQLEVVRLAARAGSAPRRRRSPATRSATYCSGIERPPRPRPPRRCPSLGQRRAPGQGEATTTERGVGERQAHENDSQIVVENHCQTSRRRLGLRRRAGGEQVPGARGRGARRSAPTWSGRTRPSPSGPATSTARSAATSTTRPVGAGDHVGARRRLPPRAVVVRREAARRAVLGRALDEPSAYEIVEPGTDLNVASTRSLG